MAERKVRFGVIGTGGMGSGHCNNIPKLPETELTAVCDTDPGTLHEIASKHGVPGFATHGELLDSGLVDAVTIATPHYFHPPIAQAAFERGIHVMSEKPIGVTVGAADAMIAAAARSGLKFSVMYQMRGEPCYRAAREIVRSGVLGDIYRTSLVMGWYRSQAYYNSGGWRATWAGEGGGVLINQAPHFLDMFAWLGGMPARVSGGARTRLHDIEVEDEAFATLEYPNGAHGYIYASTTECPGIERFEFCGHRGKLVVEDGKLRLWTVDPELKTFTRENESMWAAPKAEEQEVALPEPLEYAGHAGITRNLARAILFDEPLIAPGADGLMAVELINAMLLSGHTGEPVDVPVDRGRYDVLIEGLKAGSRAKSAVVETRATDPHYV